MITPDELVLHLQNCLPLSTDRFHDQLPVTSATVDSGILTINLDVGHGIVAGDQIYINQALIRNRIDTAELTSDGTVRFTTNAIHDLTAFTNGLNSNTWPDGLTVLVEYPTGQETLSLDPTPAGVPGTYVFEAIEGTAVPTITGEEYLLENRSVGVTGFKIVDTATATSITIDLSNVPSVPNGVIIMDHILTSIRVATVANIDRAEEIYTSQGANKAWCFVVMLDRNISKDRQNDDDFVSLPGSSLKLINIRQEYSILVLNPTDNDLGANGTKTWVYVNGFNIFNSCLHGWRCSSYLADGESKYNTAYYAHSFEYEARIQIDFEEGWQNPDTVALQNLMFTQTPYLGEI